MFLDEVTYKIVVCFVVLLAGFVISKIGERSITYLWRKKYRATIERVQIARIFSLATNIIFIIIALSFLKINITENTLIEIYSHIPLLLSAILLGILILLTVKLIFFIIDKFLSTSGIMAIVEEYSQEQNLASLLLVLRYALYLMLGLLALDSLGVNIDPTLFIFKAVLYPLLLLALVMVFAGLKPYAENFFSGLFLKNMNFLRVGEQIRIEDENYTIRALKIQGLALKGKDGFSAFVPYKKLYREEVKYREIIYDLAALESIKNHFVAQHPSYCGPASASMVLKIFGYDISQEEIGKEAKT
ncbi:MAG: mechanosensitive ion channel, partial [archaeon]|nr:mechanosensitive ion channel [archaeon]